MNNLQHTEDLYNQLLKDYDELLQENEELKKNQRYHKKGVFSLEYDKETLRDMVDELQERIEKAVEIAKDLKQFVYDELVDRNVSGATETHEKIISLLNILMVGVMNK